MKTAFLFRPWFRLSVVGVGLLGAALLAATGCAATTHAEAPAALGWAASAATLDAVVDHPGPVTVETVVGANWHVPLSGMVNLEHPVAKAAGLIEREEPIQVMFHVLRHPTRGTFIVDTGVERALFDAPDEAAIRGVVASVAHVDAMERRTDTKSWLEQEREAKRPPVAGVFLTHLHLDHVSGLRDVPEGTPVFVGPGEARQRGFENVFIQATADRALEGKPALSVWRFTPDASGAFAGVADVFGDETTWAIHVPGHTAGSVAFVVRTPQGPVLLTGDACHTQWGWDHGVEPGTFSHDRPASADSLARLRRFAARHPSMDVRVGHQLRMLASANAR